MDEEHKQHLLPSDDTQHALLEQADGRAPEDASKRRRLTWIWSYLPVLLIISAFLNIVLIVYILRQRVFGSTEIVGRDAVQVPSLSTFWLNQFQEYIVLV